MRTSPTTTDPGDDGSETLLHVSGVATPILTRMTRQSARGMTVEQTLPFLQLHTPVWDQAQKPSRIESVSVVVYDGLPRLVLDLAYDDAGQDTPASPAQPAHHADQAAPVRAAHKGVLRPRGRVDETMSFEHGSVPGATRTSPQPPPLPNSDERKSRESTQVFQTALPSGEHAQTHALPEPVRDLQLSVMEQELLTPRDFAFHSKQALTRAKPHLQHAARFALRHGDRAYRHARPWVAKLWRASAAICRLAARKLAAHVQRRAEARAAASAAKAAAGAVVPELSTDTPALPDGTPS